MIRTSIKVFILLYACVQIPLSQGKNQASVTLLSEQTHITHGSKIWLGIKFDIPDNWHIYSQMPGSAGFPPQVEWNAPENFKIEPLLWPTPKLYWQGSLANYVYEKTVLLPFQLTVPHDLKADNSLITGNINWLECDESTCVPANGQVSITLKKGLPSPTAHQALFQRTLSTLPRPPNQRWDIQVSFQNHTYTLTVRDTTGKDNFQQDNIYFFGKADTIQPSLPQKKQILPNGFTLELPAQDAFPKKRLSGILKRSGTWFDDAPVAGLLIDIPVALYTPPAKPEEKTISPLSKWLALGFLGGLILNFMPCVFPIIGIKILSFVQQAQQRRIKIIQSGLLFTAGTLISFWILAGIVFFLKSKGTEVGWGFQLQKPVFVLAITYLVFAFGLSLNGVFEIGYSLTRVGNRLPHTQGAFHSFLSGVFATLLATPCAAPFLAPALGFALILEKTESFLIFTAIALGFSFPYLLLSLFPSALKWLPKPGAWMETFKQAMGFLLHATAVYLIWVLLGQIDSDAVLGILLSFVGLAMACWAYGHVVSKAPHVNRYMKIVVIFLWGGFCVIYLGIATLAPQKEAGITWETWSPSYVQTLQQEGRIIYVDFTARWCATCQINKRVYQDKKVIQAFRKAQVVALKADWTQKDARITQTLKEFGRAAVPFNLFYTPEGNTFVLPEILTSNKVLEALRKAENNAPSAIQENALP